MRRWLGILLVFILSVSVVLPARLHAMGQTQAAKGALTHDLSARDHAMHHGHANAAETQGDLPQLPQEHRQHAVCLTACACLPVANALPELRWKSAGKRLQPPQQATRTSREPELPLKPPKLA